MTMGESVRGVAGLRALSVAVATSVGLGVVGGGSVVGRAMGQADKPLPEFETNPRLDEAKDAIIRAIDDISRLLDDRVLIVEADDGSGTVVALTDEVVDLRVSSVLVDVPRLVETRSVASGSPSALFLDNCRPSTLQADRVRGGFEIEVITDVSSQRFSFASGTAFINVGITINASQDDLGLTVTAIPGICGGLAPYVSLRREDGGPDSFVSVEFVEANELSPLAVPARLGDITRPIANFSYTPERGTRVGSSTLLSELLVDGRLITSDDSVFSIGTDPNDPFVGSFDLRAGDRENKVQFLVLPQILVDPLLADGGIGAFEEALLAGFEEAIDDKLERARRSTVRRR